MQNTYWCPYYQYDENEQQGRLRFTRNMKFGSHYITALTLVSDAPSIEYEIQPEPVLLCFLLAADFLWWSWSSGKKWEEERDAREMAGFSTFICPVVWSLVCRAIITPSRGGVLFPELLVRRAQSATLTMTSKMIVRATRAWFRWAIAVIVPGRLWANTRYLMNP